MSDSEEEEEQVLLSQREEGTYEANVAAMIKGEVNIVRESIHSSVSIKGSEHVLLRHHRPFVVPRQNKQVAVILQNRTNVKRLRLGARHYKRISSSSFTPVIPIKPLLLPTTINEPVIDDKMKIIAPVQKKVSIDTGEQLLLWEPTKEEIKEYNWKSLSVPSFLTKYLRPHQREGVRFLAECVLEQRDFNGSGSILADDMGLGKTLQSITLLYTLMTRGYTDMDVVCKKCIVICPTSLVGNWQAEIKKWVGNRLNMIAVINTSKDSVELNVKKFLSDENDCNLLIASYESIRRCVELFNNTNIDLMICDEAHRLKNDQTTTYKALNSIKCKKRILLSGTPLQNDLNEFFAMIDFTCPDVIGTKEVFRRYYQAPILEGREPYALKSEVLLGMTRSAELSAIVNDFVLRRTNIILSKHLPPKVVQIVCCKPTVLQDELYEKILHSKQAQTITNNKNNDKSKNVILPLLNNLKALCNHPYLLYSSFKTKTALAKQVQSIVPTNYTNRQYLANESGKMYALMLLLRRVRENTDDRIVFISNYTQTLDIFEYLCKQEKWEFIRLDGSTSVKNRQEKVDAFNGNNNKKQLLLNNSSTNHLNRGKFAHQQKQNQKNNLPFAFLLSSKAGGCGINLVGANRLILYDPDWNPAIDKQAAARVWRDGQTKRCYLYRFLIAGSIEEKIYQRQLSKEGLADVLGGSTSQSLVSTEDLRKLFTLDKKSHSTTHDSLNCDCLNNDDKDKPKRLQRGDPKEEDLLNWAHHTNANTVPDLMFRKAFSNKKNTDIISFIFSKEVEGQHIGDTDADEAKSISAIGDIPIEIKDESKAKELVVTATEAQSKLQIYMEKISKRRRTKDNADDDDDDDDDDDAEKKNTVIVRRSSRAPIPTNRYGLDDNDNNIDSDNVVKDPLEGVDEATRELILKLSKEDDNKNDNKNDNNNQENNDNMNDDVNTISLIDSDDSDDFI